LILTGWDGFAKGTPVTGPGPAADLAGGPIEPVASQGVNSCAACPANRLAKPSRIL
jgi:hypothetical protein